ncbi:MAG: hypothetical protein JO279_16905 [Verrucomicrobia bacterium]|nr:hypothetical protein [Verrucomicrobiota bacterium]
MLIVFGISFVILLLRQSNREMRAIPRLLIRTRSAIIVAIGLLYWLLSKSVWLS